MSEPRVRRDQDWDRSARGETETERLDRNWADLLQELRVVQTGVQLLTGFLLTLPLQQRFSQLDGVQQTIYLSTVGCAVAATALLIAPVMLHRLLFRLHARATLVAATHRLCLVGSGLLGCAVIGVVLLIFDVVRGPTVGVIAACATAVMVLSAWVWLPLALRRQQDRSEPGDSAADRT